MSTMRLGSVSLDCAEPLILATFWAALLDGEIIYRTDEIGVVKLDHCLLTVTRLEHYVAPTWPGGVVPKQAHIDVDVDNLDEAEQRAIALGAVRAGTQPDLETYVVLLDPAGHPFCLTTQIPDALKPSRVPTIR
jgi:glyoxalase superfamily protein